ncbi:S9 family peptidase [Quadrisphaera sp. DSM 44207]|uniref:S9 family peptidase n=1 Tax=Quadrisphaera sp. DSM 44207 TaxID=1881057 RepID=UPI0008927C3C|nr:S9 family peptidase [Quadrisphaera sp. DSM 44207]SDQ37080.1 oligopeptidase B Serine peptidase. MEROPS family S09A [Quadrisphaera sp. DSM 44207]
MSETAPSPAAAAVEPAGAPPVAPPVAQRVPTERVHHGDVVVDPYEWLRDAQDPAVHAHLDAENAYAAARTAHLQGLRGTLFEEIRSRTQESDLSVPVREGDWWYYTRTVQGGQHPLLCRCPVTAPDDWTPPSTEDGAPPPGERVMLDGDAQADGHAFFALGAAAVSPDGRLLAWSVDTTGDERFTLRVRDLATGADLPDEVPGVFYGATWAADSRTVLYVTVDASWRPHRVVRHRVGTPVAEDAVVHEEPDERFWLGVGRTRSDRYLVISAESKTTTEVHLLDAGAPEGEPRLVAARREGVEYAVDHAVVGGRDVLLVLHDEGAEDFALAVVDADDPAPERWRTVVEHSPGTRLDDVDAFADFVALSYRREALPRVAVLPVGPDGLGAPREVAFAEELSSTAVSSNRSFAAPLLRLEHGSFVVPPAVVDLRVADGEVLVRKRMPVLGGYDPADYEEHRDWASAPDGTRVPVSVVVRAGTPRDGTAPGLLYGYGAYEHSTDPVFSPSRLSLLDRGVVFAVAHVRGGGELGRHWYQDGKGLAKPNTFTDFVAVAEHLGRAGWIDPSRLAAMGGSAGGLLVGAVANLAPSDFAGILAAVPFVDPLTTMLDESLPLTVTEQEEWGDPLRDPAVYAAMKTYSPYENVAARPYPPILATTSLHDTRVLYVEPAKWVARLREVGGGAPQVLLKTEVDGGHGGRSGRYEAWRERAYEYAWVLDVLGLAGAPLDGAPLDGPAADGGRPA